MNPTSNIPLWGQAWELTITYAQKDGTPSPPTTISSNSWEPEPLRITFEVVQSTLPSPWWFADINIYNLNDPTTQNTLLNATWCTLKAGFQTGDNLYSTIWDGPVFQVLFDREAVVDQRLTLHCVANPLILDQIVNFAVGPGATQQQLVARMAASIGLPPIDPGSGTQSQYAFEQMSAVVYPRGKTVFGKMSKYLEQIAGDHFISVFQNGQQAFMTEIGNQSGGAVKPSITYAPPLPPSPQQATLPAGVTASIIGTPRQTLFGVIFEVLLDPRLKVKAPPMVVALDRSATFQQLPLAPNPNSGFPTALTADLTFFVGQVRHTGDTRGNAWQTEVTGYGTAYAQNVTNGVFAALSQGGA